MAAIDGIVTDRLGARLPDVTIIATGDALMGSMTTASTADGTYRFHALPPGEYTLSFRLAGFDPARRAGIRVGLSETSTVGIVVLEVASTREAVTVEGGVRLVDQRRTMMAASFTTEELNHLPGSRSASALLAATPGVQLTRFDVGGSSAIAPGPFSAYGISGYNRPRLEGISVSNMHPLGFNLDHGAFAEVSVATAAYGPEYPSPGIHITYLSKSGGNRYAGSLYAGHQPRRWQAHNIDDEAPEAAPGRLPPSEANRLHRYHDLNADVGGPLSKDRLWWYVSARNQAVATRQVLFSYAPLETRVANATGKVTTRAGDGHRLVAFWEGSRSRQPIRLDGFLRAASAVNTSVDSTTTQSATGHVWKAEWDAVLGGSTYLEVLGGQFTARRAETPNGQEPRFEDRIDPEVTGGNRDWQEDHRRDQLTASLSYFRDGWVGSHHFKIGGDAMRTVAGEEWRRAYPGDVLHVRQGGTPFEVYLFETPSRSESGHQWYTVHVNDTWQPGGRTTLNLGLRFDRMRIFLPAQDHPDGRFNPVARSFAAVTSVIAWNVLAPRLGVSQTLTADGRTLLKGSFGQYWLPAFTELGFNVNPNAAAWWRRYLWSDADGDGIWSEGEEGDLRGRQGGEVITSLDPALKLPYVREATLRLEREVASDLRVGTGVVWRGERQQGLRQRAAWPSEAFTLERTLADPGADARFGTSDDGADIRLHDLPAELVNVPSVIVSNVRDSAMNYLTWEVTADKRLSRRWALSAAFAHTWTHDHAREYAGQAIRQNEFPVTPNDYINTTAGGRHQFRVWSAHAYGTYLGPWGLSVTPFVRHQSGQPFGRTLSAALNYGSIPVLAEPVGTRRQDHLTIVDLRIGKDIALADARRVNVFVEVYNLLNSGAAQSVRWETGESFLRPLSIVSPRIARLGFRLDW
jgi:hypothetical protein